MLQRYINTKSWLTQRLANKYPNWSRIRGWGQSIGQQFIEVLAKELEDLNLCALEDLRDSVFLTCNPFQLGSLYRMNLPPTFSFRERLDGDGGTYKLPTLVRGRIGEDWYILNSVPLNTLEEFWSSLPTRLTSAEDSVKYTPIISPIMIGELSTSSSNSPAFPTRLYVTVFSNTTFLRAYGGNYVRAHIVLYGRDPYGRKIKERLVFTHNSTLLTNSRFSEVTYVETRYLEFSASIRIDWLTGSWIDNLDSNGLYIPKEGGEKFRFISLGSKTFGSTLRYQAYVMSDFFQVETGLNDKTTYREVELLDGSGLNYTASSLALSPLSREITVTDGDTLKFYPLDPPYQDYRKVQERHPECVVQLWTRSEEVCRGDTIYLDFNLTRPFVTVARLRLSVTIPSGSSYAIDFKGNLTSYLSSTPIGIESGFTRTGYQGKKIPFTLSEAGVYVFRLESGVSDRLQTQITSLTNQMDVLILDTSGVSPGSEVSIPISIGDGQLVSYDAYNRLWIINTAGYAHRVNRNYDHYFVDFVGRYLYLREPFDQIEVVA